MCILRIFAIASLFLVHVAMAQVTLGDEAALSAIYGKNYNTSTGKISWRCPADAKFDPDECLDERGKASDIEIEEQRTVQINGIPTTYVVTTNSGLETCHACAPMMGMAVFQLEKGRWITKVSNAHVGRFGAFGAPGIVKLVQVGEESWAAMILVKDGGQGYFSTEATLLMPVSGDIKKVWSGTLYEDNAGAYDPTDEFSQHIRVHADANYQFLKAKDGLSMFPLQIISRGNGYEDSPKPHSRNRIDEYRFQGDKYVLYSRRSYVP